MCFWEVCARCYLFSFDYSFNVQLNCTYTIVIVILRLVLQCDASPGPCLVFVRIVLLADMN